MQAADKAGGVAGAGIEKALKDMRDPMPGGLGGVCLPTAFTAADGRGPANATL